MRSLLLIIFLFSSGLVKGQGDSLSNFDPHEKNYNGYISKGDSLFKTGNYPSARFYYRVAHAYNPREMYPFDQIKLCEKLMNEREKESKNLEEKGDSCRKNNDNAGAEKFWTEAKRLTFSRKCRLESKLVKLHGGIADCLEDQKHLESIKLGDDLFAQKDYFAAKIAFQDALQLEPGEQYSQEMIKRCDQFLNEKINRPKFQKCMTMCDSLINTGNCYLAWKLYHFAIQLAPSEQFSLEKYKNCENNAIQPNNTGSDALLYSLDEKLKYDGRFRSYKLQDGFEYIYNSAGELTCLNLFLNGKQITSLNFLK